MSRLSPPRPLALVLPLLLAAAPPPDAVVADRPLSAWLADLDAKDPLVAEEAIEVVAGFPPRRAAAALPKLRALMASPRPVVRVRAALAYLALAGESKDATAALAAAGDVPPALRARAAEALGRTAGPDAAAVRAAVAMLGDDDYDTKRRAEAALRRMGTAGAGHCLPLLNDADARLRRNAAAYLRENRHFLTRDRVKDLRPLLAHAESDVRGAASFALFDLGERDAKVVAGLKEVFDTGTSRDRSTIVYLPHMDLDAVRALAPVLRQAVAGRDPGLRVSAAQVLHQVDKDTPALFALLKEVLAGDDRRGWSTAVTVAGNFEEKAAPLLPQLIRVLKREPEGYSLRLSLPRIGAAAVPPLVEILKDGKDGGGRGRPEEVAVEALSQMGEAAVKALVPLLDDKDTAVRLRAIRAIGPNGRAARAAVPRLVALTKDEATADAAVVALGKVGPAASAALPRLLELAKEETPAPRRSSALAALAGVGPAAADAEAAGRAALKAADRAVREQGAELLAATRPRDEALRAYVVGLLTGETTRGAGLYLLIKIGPAAAPALDAAVSCLDAPDSSHRMLALQVIGNVGKDARPVAAKVAAMLKTGSAGEQYWAVRALERLDVPAVAASALAAFLATAVDGSARHEAIAVLGRCGPAGASGFPALRRVMTSPDLSYQRAGAALALARVDSARARKECRGEILAVLRDAGGKRSSGTVEAAHALLLLDANDKEARATVARLLAAPVPDERQSACYNLAELGPLLKPHLPRLRELFADESNLVAGYAAVAVFRATGDAKETLALLESHLKAPQRYTRSAAAHFLGELGATARPSLPTLRKAAEVETDAHAADAIDAAIRKIAPPK